MLDKDCKKLLNALISDLKEEPRDGYYLSDLSVMTNFSVADVERITEHLCSEGYLKNFSHEFPGVFYSQSYCLTERGKFYKKILRKRVLDYIADKWMDILATIIALISLLISLRTALKC